MNLTKFNYVMSCGLCSCVCIILLSSWTAVTAVDVVYGYEDDSVNLVENGGFESGVSPWSRSQGTISLETGDAHMGNNSLRVTGRSQRFGGPRLSIYGAKGNKTYYLSAFFKPLSDPATGTFYQIRLFLEARATDGSFRQLGLGRLPAVRKSDRWRQLGTDFILGDMEIDRLVFKVEIQDESVEYLLDSVSLIELPEAPDWKQTADDDIIKHRKNTVTISSTIPDDLLPYVCNITYQVTQTKRHIGIGGAIQSDRLIENSAFGERFRKFNADNFDWVVFGNTMKWPAVEKNKGSYRYSRIDRAMNILEGYNISVRGHPVLWGLSGTLPNWVFALENDPVKLRAAVYSRVDSIVGRYKGRVKQWDVMNEWLHYRWFDESLDDPQFTEEIFNRTHNIDPDAELYVNDYEITKSGILTSAIVDQFLDYKDKGIPVSGIGVQSHLREVPIPPQMFKKRLDILSASGGSIVITEVSVHSLDVSVRAEQLDQALRLYYGTPDLQAILFWYYTDQSRLSLSTDSVLFEGVNLTPNEAGQVFLDRMAEWRTVTSVPETPLTGVEVEETFSAFHGAYTIQVMYKGQEITSQNFYLSPGNNITVEVPLSSTDFNFTQLGITRQDTCSFYSDDDECTFLDEDEDESCPTEPRHRRRKSGMGVDSGKWRQKRRWSCC